MNNKYDFLTQNSNSNLVSKKLSMIIHHEEIQFLTKIIQEIIEEEKSQNNTTEG